MVREGIMSIAAEGAHAHRDRQTLAPGAPPPGHPLPHPPEVDGKPTIRKVCVDLHAYVSVLEN